MSAEGLTCSCVPPPYGDGPEIDCPAHGVTCGCGRPVGVHEVGELVTTRSSSNVTWWAKACLDAVDRDSAGSTDRGDRDETAKPAGEK